MVLVTFGSLMTREACLNDLIEESLLRTFGCLIAESFSRRINL